MASFNPSNVIVDPDQLSATIKTTGAISASSASWTGGTVTMNFATPHGFQSNDVVTISGSTPSGYDAAGVVATVVDGDTITYPMVADPGAYVSGASVIEVRASGAEVFIDAFTKTIQLVVDGNLGVDGVTLKCVYSFLKEQWKNSSELIKFPFPMTPITDEQFEFYNGWNLDATGTGSAFTPNLIRTGGWAVKHVSTGADTERWINVITLGTLGTTDQVYYQQVDSVTTDNTVNFVLTGTVNQAIQVYSDPNGDGSTADGYNRTQFIKLFVREWAKTYASATLVDIGVTTMSYQAYRFPLANTADSKIVALGVTEADAGGAVAPYDNMSIAWYATAQSRTGFFSPTTSYFKVIIDADVSGVAVNPTAEQIYAFVQAALRKTTDIDADGTSVHIGKVTPEKLRFVGDDLYTIGIAALEEGVFIDDFNSTDINRIHFWGYDAASSGVEYTNIQYPYTAVLTLFFGDNLVADAGAIYKVFFSNDDSGDNLGYDYGTKDAIVVLKKDTNPMSGNVSAASYVTLEYDYDGNIQRGTASAGTDAPITVVAIGLSTAQYVKATGTIQRSISNSVSLVAPLERNYSNPA